MFLQDNADDYLSSSLSFQQAWLILGDVLCPPSVEVFEHAYLVAAEKVPHMTPQRYARQLTNVYKRQGSGESWYRYDEGVGRLVAV